MGKVKGSIIEARKRFVLDGYGPEAWEETVIQLKPELQKILRAPIRRNAWHPFQLFRDLNHAIDARFGHGDLQLCRRMGYFGADYNLPTLNRVFYRVSSPGFIMRRATHVWSANYDSGSASVEELEKHHVILHIEGFDTPEASHCLSVQGWCERAIELSGANDPVSTMIACRVRGDARCSFECKWN